MGWLSDTWDTVKENASDICHGALDAAGFIPVVGAIPDVINGCIYAVEGNALDAGMSFAAAIPGVGDIGAVVGKGGKYLLKGGKWLLGKGKKLLKGTGKLMKALKKSKFLGKLAKLLGKMKVGAKALFRKGKELLGKIAKKFKKKCKNGHCFVEGTLVWTEQGLQEIETIPSGALIYARNEETGEVGLKRVKRTLGGKAHTIYTIGIGEHGIIQSTNYHRYYVEEKGWVSAIQLQIGDELYTIEGEHVEITSIEKERQEEGVAVYNFVVEDWESYFVSRVGVYVHNDPCNPMSEYDAAKAANWTRPDGTTWWPPNNGAVPGTEKTVTLPKDTVFGRIGKESGSYVAPPNTKPEKLALKPGTDTSIYNEYRVVKDIPNVEKAEVAAWFDQPGGATQYKLPASVGELVESGHIEMIIK